MNLRFIQLRWSALLRCIMIVHVVAALSIVAAIQPSSSAGLIPTAEFVRLIQDFSEPGGYFQSDNLISNEDAYLTIAGNLKELGASGGAYIGVGPEQNFTYIAKIRPSIAFIIDVRRQAMIQHLMYKAIFNLSRNRAEFMARWLSRPLKGKGAPGADASINQLIKYFSLAPADAETFQSNLDKIETTIRSDFHFPLSDRDRASLENIYRAFHAEGISISFQMGSSRGRYGHFSSMKELLEQLDPDGKPGNYLASEEDYQFIRSLHHRNRIIPLVGDFAGEKTFKAVAGYLRKNSYSVSVFYVSNVEQFLFQNGLFDDFVGNVKILPITPGSLFIRSFPNYGRNPLAGIRMKTRLQKISTFLKDYDEGLYFDYPALDNAHSIPLKN